MDRPQLAFRYTNTLETLRSLMAALAEGNFTRTPQVEHTFRNGMVLLNNYDPDPDFCKECGAPFNNAETTKSGKCPACEA